MRYQLDTSPVTDEPSATFNTFDAVCEIVDSVKSATGITLRILEICDLCDNPREIENLCANCAGWSDGNLDSNN